MKPVDLYTTAHRFVAAVRVLDHLNDAPPALDAVCRLMHYSDEQGSYLLNRFKEAGIVDTVKSGFSDRIVVGDHLAIERLPREMEASRLELELKRFKAGKDAMQAKVESIKAQQSQKKQTLFASIEKQLKEKIDKP